jgi:hypothetical protein
VASAVLLIPGQSRQALGIELMPIALIYIGFSTLTTIAATRSQRGISRDRLARFFFGELSAGLIFVGGLGLVIHALGGAYLVAAGIILGVLSSMLAIWSLFVGLGFELEGKGAAEYVDVPPMLEVLAAGRRRVRDPPSLRA